MSKVRISARLKNELFDTGTSHSFRGWFPYLEVQKDKNEQMFEFILTLCYMCNIIYVT
jgi:hypothetical protein